MAVPAPFPMNRARRQRGVAGDIRLRRKWRAAQEAAAAIIRRRADIPGVVIFVRWEPSLAVHMACEAFDLRGAGLRKVAGKRRQTVWKARERMWDRRDECPALDAFLQAEIDKLKEKFEG